MPKPAGFQLTVTVLWIFLVAGVVVAFLPAHIVPTVAGANPQAMAMAAKLQGPIAIISALIAGVFIYFYGKGENWARWVIMIASILYIIGGLFGLITIAVTPAKGTLGLLEAIFGVYLIYYLNTAAVKTWFEAPKLPA